jgi:mono/diheme cytochrome c family protein
MTTRAWIAGALVWLAATASADAPPPEEDYVLHCSGCHRQRGAGVPNVVPPLTRLAPFLSTGLGRAYLVRVPGVAQAALDDDRLAALLNWVLSEMSGVEAAPRYSAGEVRALRARPLRDPRPERRAALGR